MNQTGTAPVLAAKKGKGIKMAKKMNEQVVDIDIDDIEAVDDINIIEEAITAAEEVITEEVEEVKDKPKGPRAIDIINKIKDSAPEYADLADGVTPNMIDRLFLLDDQGKTVRRYLRRYFSEHHIQKSSWVLTKKEATEVIAYLTTKYGEPHWENLEK